MQNSYIDNYGAMRNGMRYNRLLRIMLAQQNVSPIFLHFCVFAQITSCTTIWSEAACLSSKCIIVLWILTNYCSFSWMVAEIRLQKYGKENMIAKVRWRIYDYTENVNFPLVPYWIFAQNVSFVFFDHIIRLCIAFHVIKWSVV